MSAMAAAVGVQAAIEAGIRKGTLVVIGTPAEEAGGGKIELIDRGAFQAVDAAMMVHPCPMDVLYPSVLCIERVMFEYHGKNAHASASPWDGVNALDSVICLFNNIGLARQHFKPEWRVHGIITDGGQAANIIPDYAAAEFFIRAPDPEQLAVLRQRVVGCAEGAAAASSAKLKVIFGGPVGESGFSERTYENLRVNSILADLYGSNVSEHGVQYGPREWEETLPTGSTDMGNVSHCVPSIHPMFAIPATEGEGNHHPGFTAACDTQPALDAARVAAKAMSASLVDLMMQPALLERAAAEFRA
eukprot:TRINITY_DN18697_c0_g1_i1.p1 TRINITY_DN18697_c0_g1~~TRINITY_DN18697_c0_g1_i1.p1  ORF type:complete len:303 (+),score=77.19 TRINITY_DN18697_c0_g1_i1:152-1060(+)